MKVLLAHPGTQHAPRLAAELAARDCLHGFWTGLSFAETSLVARTVARFGWPGRAASRVCAGVPREALHTRAFHEMAAHLRVRMGGPPEQVFHQRNARFQATVPDHAVQASDAVIGFDTSSWLLADRCRRLDRRFLLDRSIGHPDGLHRALHAITPRYPEWVRSSTVRPAAVCAAEAQEHALAHRIVVGGSFARETLLHAGVPADRIRVNPYGVDWDKSAPPEAGPAGLGRPFRFLFAGTVGARKGVPVLLEAWRAAALPDAELWIAGGIEPRLRSLIPPQPGLRLLGRVPRGRMTALYAQADVFVLPSLFEGFGLVLLEALAAGLPVITTPHTGGADFLPHDQLGQLVEAGSVEALVEALRHWAAHPPARALVRAAAMSLAERYSWRAYGDRWMGILDEN